MQKLTVNLIFMLWIYSADSTQFANSLKPALLTPASANSTSNTHKTVSFVPKNDTQSRQNVSISAEGGTELVEESKEVHRGREHVTEKAPDKPKTSINTPKLPITSVNITGNTTNNNRSGIGTIGKIIPVREQQDLEVALPNKDDDKKSVPKKGVTYTKLTPFVSSNPNKSATVVVPSAPSPITEKVIAPSPTTEKASAPSPTTKKVPHKPFYTEPGDESEIKNLKVSDDEAILKQNDNLDNDKKKRRSEYIIPIVAVILSVPLVAILISFLYKQSKYWWQHRNYRRMDFLIEGIYHN